MSTKCKKTLGGLLTYINVPVLMKDFVGRSTARMNCLEAEY